MTLWSQRQTRVLLAADVFALTIVLVSWAAASTRLTAGEQTRYVALALGGVLVSAAGSARWLLGGRAAIGRRRSALLTLTVPTAHIPDDRLVTSEAMTRYHRPDCDLVLNKACASRSRGEHHAAGRTACGICRP